MKKDLEEQIYKWIEDTISVQAEKYYSELIIQNKRYLNKKEVCIYLGISYATAVKYVFSTTPELRFGKTIKFDKADVDYWFEDNKLFKL